VLPAQIALLPEIAAGCAGTGVTVTTTASVKLQLPLDTVTVYVVVLVGVAVGLETFVALRPVVGNHEYVPPPVALSTVELPEQIETSAPALTLAGLATVTVTWSSAVHEPLVTVNVYVVVVVGFATGFKIVVELKPVGGVHA